MALRWTLLSGERLRERFRDGVAEKCRIVEKTLEPVVSVALIEQRQVVMGLTLLKNRVS
jgi:hypothetical protein